jgi:hypothetical protein
LTVDSNFVASPTTSDGVLVAKLVENSGDDEVNKVVDVLGVIVEPW